MRGALIALIGAALSGGALAFSGCGSAQPTDQLGGSVSPDPTAESGVTNNSTDAPQNEGSSAATTAPPSTSPSASPLCNVAPGDPCFPDDRPTKSLTCAPSEDAGAPRWDGAVVDAGAGRKDSPGNGAGDGADAGAGAQIACHVLPGLDGLRHPTCVIAGDGVDGAECLSGNDCAATFECVGSPGRCRAYCCGFHCASHSFCQPQSLTGAATFTVPVCTPVQSCQLFAAKPNACSAQGATCAVIDSDGTTSCVPIGTAKPGDDCETKHCGEDMSCLGSPGSRRCRALCRLAVPSDCPGGQTCHGSVALLKDPDLGLCE